MRLTGQATSVGKARRVWIQNISCHCSGKQRVERNKRRLGLQFSFVLYKSLCSEFNWLGVEPSAEPHGGDNGVGFSKIVRERVLLGEH